MVIESNTLSNGMIIARIERLPLIRKLLTIRIVIGTSTFFDAYTILALAFAMPQLATEWNLSPTMIGLIISASYIGQLFGALFFGSLAGKIGRLGVLKITIVLFVLMDIAVLFAWSGLSILIIRFFQGIGIGAEVPVASAYINEFSGSEKRGKFFLLYEIVFPIGLMFAGIMGYLLVPLYGWKILFIIGLVPSIIMLPLRWFLPESPRWLASQGRLEEANSVVKDLENRAIKSGHVLAEPIVTVSNNLPQKKSNWKELFQGIYKQRTFMIWCLWVSAYLINNGLITWLPTLYRQIFHLSLETSLAYGWITSAVGVFASILCALYIDKVGRKKWYSWAFMLAIIPFVILFFTGASNPIQILVFASLAYAILQTVTFSLYLYSSEIYPTRLRTIGTGLGSAWLRAGSSVGPILVGSIVGFAGIQYVFLLFAAVSLFGCIITSLYAIETKGRVLEELSP